MCTSTQPVMHSKSDQSSVDKAPIRTLATSQHKYVMKQAMYIEGKEQPATRGGGHWQNKVYTNTHTHMTLDPINNSQKHKQQQNEPQANRDEVLV